jgi:hypothetical protein
MRHNWGEKAKRRRKLLNWTHVLSYEDHDLPIQEWIPEGTQVKKMIKKE